MASKNGSLHQQPLAHRVGEHALHDLFHGEHLRPAELVRRVGVGFPRQRRDDRLRHVAGEHGLDARLAAADQRQDGRDTARALPKRLKKSSSGPNTIEGLRIMASGRTCLTAASPAALLRA